MTENSGGADPAALDPQTAAVAAETAAVGGAPGELPDPFAAGQPVVGGTLPDPFGSGTGAPDPVDPSPISAQTQGALDSVGQIMKDAKADYDAIAKSVGASTDLPAPGAESAQAFIDATMQADEEQLRRMAGQIQGDTYFQEVRNDVRAKEEETRQAIEHNKALSDAEMEAWRAERAVAAAEAAVAESRRTRGV